MITTFFVFGSIRNSESWSASVTQTLPAPTTTFPNSLAGTVMSAATVFV
jgi:hypothetical protein